MANIRAKSFVLHRNSFGVLCFVDDKSSPPRQFACENLHNKFTVVTEANDETNWNKFLQAHHHSLLARSLYLSARTDLAQR